MNKVENKKVVEGSNAIVGYRALFKETRETVCVFGRVLVAKNKIDKHRVFFKSICGLVIESILTPSTVEIYFTSKVLQYDKAVLLKDAIDSFNMGLGLGYKVDIDTTVSFAKREQLTKLEHKNTLLQEKIMKAIDFNVIAPAQDGLEEWAIAMSKKEYVLTHCITSNYTKKTIGIQYRIDAKYAVEFQKEIDKVTGAEDDRVEKRIDELSEILG